jgi:ABC-2 type transport system permease protein
VIQLIILIVAAVFVAVRLWFRFRRRSSGAGRPSPWWKRRPGRTGSTGSTGPGVLTRSGPFASGAGLVAAREMRERFRGRIFRVGTVLILAVVAAAIVIPTLTSSKPAPQHVGVVGTLSPSLRSTVSAAAKSAGTTAEFATEPSEDSARSALRSGRLDLAISDGGHQLTVNKPIQSSDTSTTAQFVRATSRSLGVAEAVQAANLSPSQSSTLAGAKAVPVSSVQPGSTKGPAQSTSLIGLILVFVMLTQYNTWILMGVMEEKSSRVVEVLLAAVRPIQLLTGKVLGIGLVAFSQAALIVAVALILAEGVGSTLLHGTAPLVLVSTLVWLVLGYAFYCWVYAAAGSTVERQDQVQTLAFPLSLPIIFAYIFSLTTLGTGNASTFFKVLAYLPPTAPFAMPVLVALHSVSLWEFLASVVLTIVCTFGVARVAAGIYRRAILRTGRRVQLRSLLSHSG